MTDRSPLYDEDETPEDVATLYSWANLHGAKYRDFSASRAQTREQARLRMQQAIEEEQARAQQAGSQPHFAVQSLADLEHAAEIRRVSELQRIEEEAHLADLAAQQESHAAAQEATRQSAEYAAQEISRRAAQQAAQRAVEEAAIQSELEAARQASERAEEQRAAERAVRQAAQQAAERAAQQAELEAARQAAERAEQQQAAERAARQAAQQAAERAARQAELEAARQAAVRAEQQKAAELAARQAAQQAAQQAAEQAARQAELEAAKQAAERAAQQQEAQRAARQAELQATRQAAEKAAQQLAAQRAALQAQAERDAAQRAREQAAQQAEQQAARQAAERAAQQQAAQRAAEEAARRTDWKQQKPERMPSIPAAESAPSTSRPTEPQYPAKPGFPGYAYPQPKVPVQPQRAAMREDNQPPSQNPWGSADQQENTGRPAWLTPDAAEAGRHQPVPQAPEDTLQGSRDRLTSRWFALRGMFEGAGAPVEAAPAPLAARAPVVAIFSLAGGVGKTSLVATLGRALSARGEKVLLVDTAPYGLLPFFFGARDQRPGLLRTFSPPGTSGDAPIQMVTIDPEGLGTDAANTEALTSEISTYSRGVSRVIVDLATASGATTRRVLRMSPLVLVPLVPDMNSVVSFSSIDSFFQHNGNASLKPSLPYYVLNQFDPALPLHLDIREVLREQLGDRLLSFALRRAPAVSEALAEGMTVMDYAPSSTIAEDFGSLAGWVKSQSAPASSAYRGVRWSER